MVDMLLSKGYTVVVYDNLSTGRMENIKDASSHNRFSLVRDDLLNADALTRAMKGCEIVFHLAANADVRFGLENPRRDLEQNTIATFNVLEAMRSNGIDRIVFTSTGSVYGEPELFPTPEEAPFPVQTSLYGAAKLACEALIQAYCEGYGFRGYIFRCVSILGERYSHGHVFDFYRSLRKNPDKLHVLGDGHQRKSYLYVGDCIDAMLLSLEKAGDTMNLFNIGTNEYCEVNESIEWICEHLGVKPDVDYAGGVRGWIGDSPFIFLDCGKIRSLGWRPRCSIRDGVIRTVKFLQGNSWLFEERS